MQVRGQAVLGYDGFYPGDVFVINADGTNGQAVSAQSGWWEVFHGLAPSGAIAIGYCVLPYCTESFLQAGGAGVPYYSFGGVTADSQFVVEANGTNGHNVVAVGAGGAVTALAADPATDERFVAIHPDNRVIYRVSASGQWDLYSVTNGGGGTVALGDGSLDEYFDGTAPNGRIVYQDLNGTRLYSINADGTDRRLLHQSTQTMTFQGFTTSGKVAYLEVAPQGGSDLFLVDHDGSAPVNLTSNPSVGAQRFVRSLP